MEQKKPRRLSLFWRLMGFITAAWLVLLTIAMSVTLHFSLRTSQEEIDSILMSTVVTLGNYPKIQELVEQGSFDQQITDYLNNVIIHTDCIEYITIADKNSIRLYHLHPDFIGLPFEGGDQQRALAGEIYFSNVESELFDGQHRAFHPIRDDGGEVIGFVMASASFTRIRQLRSDIVSTYFRLFLQLLLFFLVLSGVLAVYLGRHLRGARPEDLVKIYLTQSDILNAIDNGLLSFDNSGQVRLVNAAAARMLGQREELLVGQQVDDLLRSEDGASLRNRERQTLQSSRPNILVTPITLPDANLWARQVLILADKSEVTRYAEELMGTRHLVSALRARTHEFLNKLQVISGLLQMGKTEEAQQYIGNLSSLHEQVITPVMKRIRNSGTAGLILGKYSHMRELNIGLILMPNSSLPEHSRFLSTNELVTVVGNLMENAIEAANGTPKSRARAMAVQITEDEKGLLIMVSDSGRGIREENLPHIYEHGFSTKAADRGTGMALVKQIVDNHGGTIDVETEPDFGTTFTIILNRERGEQV